MSETIGFDVKEAQIRLQPVFSDLTEDEVRVLSTLLTERHIRAGETIVTQGEPVDSVYFIVRGKANVVRISINSAGIPDIEHITKLGEGETIGLNETGFYSISGIRTATVIADTNMILLQLSVAAFHGFALSNTHVNDVMHKHASYILGK